MKNEFRYLTITFYTNIFSLACLLVLSSLNDDQLTHNFVGITLLTFIISHLAFLYFIGALAASLKKNVFAWVLGSMILFGNIIAYYRMKVNAVMNGWD